MIILHYNETTKEIHEDDSSYRYRSLMTKPQLVLKFSLPEYIEFPIGTWCEFQNERYTLNQPQNIKKNGTRNIGYTLTMGGDEDYLGIYKMRNGVDHRLKWSMCAKPHEFIEEIVKNLNERMGDNVWSVGTCIEASEKTVEFNHAYIDAALQDIANAFDTEWEIADHVISLHKVEYFKESPLSLSYGKGNGFIPGVGRSTASNEQPIKRLYVQGGDKNIDSSKYGSSELLLPKSQTLEYEGRTYQSDAEGLYIERIDKVSDAVKEDSLDCSETYPSRVGTVTSVEVINADNNFYDVIDNTIPDNLNFNDYLIAGENMTIIFQSGMLASKEFELKYKHAERRFEIVPQEIDGVTMPNDTWKPQIGDTYAVFGCMLPDAYICDNDSKTGASWDMFKEGAKYLYENEEQKFTFMGTLQGLYAKRNWDNIGGYMKVGAYIHFSDAQFAKDGVDIRITGVKDFLTTPYSPTIEISNSVSGQSVSSQLREIDNQEVVIDDTKRSILQYAKRRFRDARETMEMLEASLLENFTNSVTPITVQTMAMLVGDESLQFRFVGSRTNPQTVAHSIVYDNTTRQLSAAAGLIQHLTLGIKSISASHTAAEYKYWQVPAYTSARLDDESKKYYLYIKASKSDETAEFILSEKAVKMEGVADYYHFLVGILNSGYGGERSFATLYGFTEVLPGRITTDRIVSSGGDSYFDMAADAMKLGSVFDFNSQGDGKLRLRGTLVQSEGGTESYIGCYRGVWNSAYTYYEGDEIAYTNNGATCTYRYINPNPSKGNLPTDSVYWEVLAKGADGKDAKNGDWVSFVFKQSETKPSKPTGTSSIPQGWSDAPTATGKWWMSKAVINGTTGRAGAWSEPVQTTAEDGADGAYTDFKYAKNTSGTSAPAIVTTDRNPTEWADEPPALSDGEYLWMSQAEINADDTLKSSWSTPVRISGEKGDDGTNGSTFHFIYTLASRTPTTPVFQTQQAIMQQALWKTKPLTPTATHFLYMSQALLNANDGKFGSWSTPVRISGTNGKNGEDGTDIEFVYKRNTGDTPSKPTSVNTDDYVPDGWTGSPSGITETYKYEWICVRTKPKGTGSWSEYSTPVVWAKWGDKGQAGDGMEYIFKRTEVETAPDAIIISSAADKFVPPGWTDEPSGVSADYPFEWVSMRQKTNGAWGDFSTAKLWANYTVWNPNLLEQTGFESRKKMDKWDYKSVYDGGMGPEDGSPHIMPHGPEGRNFYHDANTKRMDESVCKEVLRQRLWTSAVGRLQPSTWYTFSFWEKCGSEIFHINAASSAYGFAEQTLYLFKGQSYKMVINGHIDAQALADGKSLAVYIFNPEWSWFKSVMTTSTTPALMYLNFDDVPQDGVYKLLAYLYDSTEPRTGTATLNWVRIESDSIFATYIYPSAIDTAKVFVDGVQMDNSIGTDCAVKYPSSGGVWKKHAITFKTKARFAGDEYLLFRLLPVAMNGSDYHLNICMPKLEAGKVATSYSPSSDDSHSDYQEYRFAKNGSRNSAPYLVNTDAEPDGWTAIQPSVGTLEYLWMTVAKKSATGALLTNWSNPVRITPYDGKDGASGESPVMVYRGVYDSSKTYYGNKYRLDCVKQGTEYYIARIDAGTFSTPAPPGTSKWNVFGASFESIATNLLLAEGANIGDWFISQGRIVSTLESGKPVIILDANVPRIEMKSARTGGGYGEYGNGTDSDKPSKLAMDALTGQFEARGSDGHVAYVSANGIFSNHAMTNALPESTGFRHYGSVVGIGFGDVPKGNYDMAYNQTLIAGVYGSASNTGTAPAFGGYFNKLFARGFYCQRRSIESGDAYSTQLNGSDFLVVGYNNNEKVVFLPNTAIQSQEIIVAGWMGGSIIIKSSGGQKLYHGKDEISSFRVVSGEICTCFFVVGYDAKGSRTEAWLCTSYKTGA